LKTIKNTAAEPSVTEIAEEEKVWPGYHSTLLENARLMNV
jgi:hypothetical protein